ncbi:energy-coupling factor ABC transporter permease [Cellulomonas xiejunii]|uniref:Energy-coupling factor ABC transporter permease n=1 Tax=Cellulomonas xiejunii TaxID=2968083 RepID=A0ABY5KRV8_9CELL|nr:energy-coupling factor ABC transporter permease [Cellulomonas xiejunii]MCC2322562.1 energy-coupling factor ABC transporter permease [Cellulomonas xiejunii]UUI72598.1 energy-coupling factor ABC transporter permease [Cellulomonas xiejunii]
MHVPDQYLSDPVSVTTAAAAGAVVVAAALRARRGAARAPHPAMIGATTAAVFGLQMVNYPVGSGTSGHLMGGALAAALLGPAWGLLSVSLVLVVQAVVFADGGLTALGTNTLLMAVVGTLVGWVVARGVVGAARRRSAGGDGRAAGAVGAALGGAAGVVAAAALFVGLYAVGGTVGVPTGALAAQMLGVHALIGIGEAVITGAVVAVVVAVRPQAVALTARDGAPARSGALRPAGVLAGLAGLAAVVLSSAASSAPDGLEATAARTGFAGAARDHALAGWPLADYGEAAGVLVAVAGAVGVLVCAALAAGAAAAVARSRTTAEV